MDKKEQIFMEITANRSAIMAVIVAMVRNFDQAEDIFQDTVLEIVRSAERFRLDGAFLPWARGIARNMVRRARNAQMRNPILLEEDQLEFLADLVCADDNQPEIWEKERSALQTCLTELSDKNHQLFLLRYGQNSKGSDLSEKSGVNASSVRTTLSRIRQFLRKCINNRLDIAGAPANG